MKRIFDLVVSGTALFLFSPFIVVGALLVYLHDRGNPFYCASRVGKNEIPFRMWKLRSMSYSSGGPSSTANTDSRITPIGRILRKGKLDELPQLINVLFGTMSLVGPRPNVPNEVALYTPVEKRLLEISPGITDFASIVFSDEGDILSGSGDPDRLYNEIIRPWKSRLGLLYRDNHSFMLDIQLLFLTVYSVLRREKALCIVASIVKSLGADDHLVAICRREGQLPSGAPP